MKILLIFSFLIFTLVGCDNSDDTTNSNIQANRISTNLKTEENISTFSTDILIKDSNRQNNIQLACSTLNGTIVRAGETFSFCDTVGQAKPENGYEKADIFDSKGNIIKEYGGGKCQLSSTLYNAVLSCAGLTVVERHPHSRKVDYVESGKDAAISYGSADFKFKNDNNYNIKIYSSATNEAITIRLVKI